MKVPYRAGQKRKKSVFWKKEALNLADSLKRAKVSSVLGSLARLKCQARLRVSGLRFQAFAVFRQALGVHLRQLSVLAHFGHLLYPTGRKQCKHQPFHLLFLFSSPQLVLHFYHLTQRKTCLFRQSLSTRFFPCPVLSCFVLFLSNQRDSQPACQSQLGVQFGSHQNEATFTFFLLLFLSHQSI